MATYETILLKADGLYFNHLKDDSHKAAAAILPGMFLQLNSADTVQAHSGAGLAMPALIALENHMLGKTVDDGYVTGDKVFTCWLREGDVVWARLANGETAVIGSKLESNGDGYLRVVDTDTSALTIEVGSIIATAIEAVDMSGSSAVDPSGWIAVRISRG